MSSAQESYGAPDTRQQILEATRELLESSGGAVTLADAAKRAGVSRQAVYLHFGDRTGLLVAVVQFVDESLDAADLKAHMWSARTGAETLQRWVESMSVYTARIDAITRVLEAGQDRDQALAAAWQNRMDGRRAIIRTIVERIVADGDLSPELTCDTAVELIHTVTMPGPWRELVGRRGWTPQQYSTHVGSLLRRGLLASR